MALPNNITDKVLEYHIQALCKLLNERNSGGNPPDLPPLLSDPEHLLVILTELQTLRSANE